MITKETILEYLTWKEFYKSMERKLPEIWAKDMKENKNTKLWKKLRRKK